MVAKEHQYSDENRVYSIEEFMNIPDDGYRHELVKGHVQKMPPPVSEHLVICGILQVELGYFVKKHHLGLVGGGNGGYALTPDTVYDPDVSFIASEHLPLPRKKYIPFAPDLAVEVISPANRQSPHNKKNLELSLAMHEKIDDYLSAGVRLLWIIDPDKKTVDVYHPNDDIPVTLTLEDELDGEDVVPGFRMPVRDLFPDNVFID